MTQPIILTILAVTFCLIGWWISRRHLYTKKTIKRKPTHSHSLSSIASILNNKNLNKESCFQKLEDILKKMETENHLPENRRYTVSINRDTGSIVVKRYWTIVHYKESLLPTYRPDYQITIEEAIKRSNQKHFKVGSECCITDGLTVLKSIEELSGILQTLLSPNKDHTSATNHAVINSHTNQYYIRQLNIPKVKHINNLSESEISLSNLLNLDTNITKNLINNGYHSINAIVNADKQKLSAMCGCSESFATEIIHRAIDIANSRNASAPRIVNIEPFP
jgi:hypothetical protein